VEVGRLGVVGRSTVTVVAALATASVPTVHGWRIGLRGRPNSLELDSIVTTRLD
jgi:hypothetical protein